MRCPPSLDRVRPLQRSRFALLARWLAEPLVARWWNHKTSAAAIEREFGPSVPYGWISEAKCVEARAEARVLHQDHSTAAGERGAGGDGPRRFPRAISVKSPRPTTSSSGASTPHGVARKGPSPCRVTRAMVDAALGVEHICTKGSARRLEGSSPSYETGDKRRPVPPRVHTGDNEAARYVTAASRRQCERRSC